MNAVLVTGAGGFIGSYAAAEFAARGWKVFGTFRGGAPVSPDRPADIDAALRGVEFLRVDVRDPAALAEAVAKASGGRHGGLGAIVHCAGRATDIGRKRDFADVNVGCVRTLVGLARERDVGRLVFISTTDVYGLRDFHGEDEAALPLSPYPRNPYPESKVEAEEAIRSALRPDRYSMLRPAQVWGVGDRTLTARIESFLRSSPVIVHFGPWRGANRWPLAHVRNVAKACFLAAVRPEAAGRAFNVVDPERTTIDEFTRIVASVYLPARTFRTVCLPMWTGLLAGRAITAVSNALGLDRPLMDPSHYAVYAVSRNLDLSGAGLATLMESAGEKPFTREQGVRELQAHASDTLNRTAYSRTDKRLSISHCERLRSS